jgi:hypothetical protein
MFALSTLSTVIDRSWLRVMRRGRVCSGAPGGGRGVCVVLSVSYAALHKSAPSWCARPRGRVLGRGVPSHRRRTILCARLVP